jgi:hypothetical protein
MKKVRHTMKVDNWEYGGYMGFYPRFYSRDFTPRTRRKKRHKGVKRVLLFAIQV